MTAPLILTCGEPGGIGPELAVRALEAGVPFVWLGDPRHLPEGTAWAEVATPRHPAPPGTLPVLRHDFAAPATPGRPDPANAQGVIDVIARAVGMAMRGEAGGICTLPISKQALKEGAGFAFPARAAGPVVPDQNTNATDLLREHHARGRAGARGARHAMTRHPGRRPPDTSAPPTR